MTIKRIRVSESLKNKILAGKNKFHKLNPRELSDRCSPGEWINLQLDQGLFFLAYANPQGKSGLCLRVCGAWVGEKTLEDWLREKIEKSIFRRKKLGHCLSSSRLIYGQSDELPGLVVDAYKNAIIVEINTMGMWLVRESVKVILGEHIPSDKEIIFRSRSTKEEMLPLEESKVKAKYLHIEEDKIEFKVPMDSIQKLGFYFDHRENRLRLRKTISEISLSGKRFVKGLDLFCYQGSWGLNLLHSGVSKVIFVDQGDFKDSVIGNIELNNFASRGEFKREDVFRFLDQQISSQSFYDCVVSDPPAFTKDKKGQDSALRGYAKLHEKCLRVCAPESIFVAASCTSFVNYVDLDEAVQRPAKKLKKKVWLIDIGMQKSDHPIKGLKGEENYIKYLCYYVE